MDLLPAQSTASLDALIDERGLAHTGIASLGTIRRWRREGRGPLFIRIGRLVRYRVGDVRNFLNSRPSGGEGGRIIAKPTGQANDVRHISPEALRQ